MARDSSDPDIDPDGREESEPRLSTISSAYKVLGEFTDSGGAGILGINNADSGTPIGVEGAVPNAPSSGYGLYTAHDAKIEGAAEVSILDGDVTNQQALTALPGNELAIDQQGVLNYTGPTYQNTTLDASGTTWDPVGTLSSTTLVEVTVDTEILSNGRARVDVDGARGATLNGGDVLNRIFRPSSTLTVNTLDGWRYNQSVDVSSEDTFPSGVAFKDDGTKMFVVGSINSKIFSYDLSTAWDVTSATLDTSYDVSSEDSTPRGVSFKNDGTRMYVLGVSNDNIYQYDLSTAWDVTSATLDTSYGVVSVDGLTFKDDGTKLYTSSNLAPRVRTYTLGSAWDVSTAEFSGFVELLDTGEQLTGIAFNSNGSRLLVCSRQSDTVYEFILSTDWDVSTASLLVQFDVGSEDPIPEDVTLKPDDTELFVPGSEFASVHSYDKGFSGTVHASSQRE